MGTVRMARREAETVAGVRYAPGDGERRPWGSWEVLAIGAGYALKRIVVDPGQRLSLQYHHHRAEHWTIVGGSAEVEIDEVVTVLNVNEHVHIPKLARHRIRNPGGEPLIFIEVQIGAIVDEADIVRLSDDYGR
jgi:mannose-6-phosphate isomerase